MHALNDYSIGNYGSMINDERRMSAFVEALRRAVRDGSTVLDIGTGTGIFALLACQFGASRVYAVEPDPAIELAKRCAATTSYADRITWIRDISTEIELPEKVDVVIGDLHGTLPFFKGNVESMYDARRRHLKPGGVMIPRRDTIRVRPAQAEHEYRQVTHPWRQNDYGLDLGAGATLVANRWWRAESQPIEASAYLGETRDWGLICYGESETSDLANTLQWTADKEGTLHGFYAWFDADLVEGVGYSNAPELPELVYGRAFFPVEQPIRLESGDEIRLDISVRMLNGEHLYRWKTVVSSSAGDRKAAYDQSTFRSRITDKQALNRLARDAMPILDESGHIARMVLEALDGTTPLATISELVAREFPNNYRAPEEALKEVTRLANRYAQATHP